MTMHINKKNVSANVQTASAETLVIKDYSNFRSCSIAAISMVVVCHIQAGVPVIVKWKEGHAVMVDLHTVRAIS